MTTAATEFEPDYVVSPGEILEEILEARGMKKRQLADRSNKSTKLISQIIAGIAPVSPDTAIAFERVLGVRASLWNNLESRYRLHLAKQDERARLASNVAWANRFPLARMKKFGLVGDARKPIVEDILDFFGVANTDAWENVYLQEQQRVAFRASRAFQSSPYAIAAWLRWGEKHAESLDVPAFDKDRFKTALNDIRALTRLTPEEFHAPLKELCSRSGVVVLWLPELDGTRLSGATKWLGPEKVMIQLSLRHRTDDHFWFSFFHEAAHVLLHGKKAVFIDDASNTTTKEEDEANLFAQNHLIPRSHWARLTRTKAFSRDRIVSFADDLNIAPGIVVGQLQHARLIPYTHLNGLKRKFVWADQRYN